MGGRQPTAPPGAAAAAYLAPLLRGRAAVGTVVAVRSDAALAAIGSGAAARLVAIADRSAGATRTANTVLVSEHVRLTPGATVRVGEGGVQLAGRGYPIRRYWPSALPAGGVDPAAVEDLTDAGAPGLPTATVRPLRTALAIGSGLGAAARSLVGLGPGSTPAGDDVLAGVALGLRATARWPLLARLEAAIGPDLTDRTTALSADLVRAALAGHASPEVLALVRTLRPGVTPADRRRATDLVLRLGHTSGADLVLGLTAALRVTVPCPSPRPHPELPVQSRRMADR